MITKRKALEAAAREAYELLKEKSEEINTFFDCALDFNYLFLEAVLKRNPKRTFSVLHARNGKEAIDFCMDIPSIQLVLMDIKMPIDRNLLFQLLEKHVATYNVSTYICSVF